MTDFPADSSLVERVVPSPNLDERAGGDPDMILLHYTGMQSARGRAASGCATPRPRCPRTMSCSRTAASCRWCRRRAARWHAGVSSWAGETDINSRSIGIEIVNPGHEFGYPDFPTRQIAAVIALCRGILTRRAIAPRAHAGAFRRGAEPQAGSGREVSVAAARATPASASGSSRCRSPTGSSLVPGDTGDNVTRSAEGARRTTATASPLTGDYDDATKIVVTAFQRHFRPAQVDGIADASTRETLRKPARDGRSKPRRQDAASRTPRPRARRTLTAARRSPPSLSRQSAGRPLRQSPKGGRGGKSGLHGQTVPDNVRRGRAPGKVPQRTDRRGALCIAEARVKRCGKSAPRFRQRKRHGKPHREQNRIGTARERKSPALVRAAVRVGCFRRRATGVAEEWPSRSCAPRRAIQNPAYRPADTLRGLGGNTAGPPPISARVIDVTHSLDLDAEQPRL